MVINSGLQTFSISVKQFAAIWCSSSSVVESTATKTWQMIWRIWAKRVVGAGCRDNLHKVGWKSSNVQFNEDDVSVFSCKQTQARVCNTSVQFLDIFCDFLASFCMHVFRLGLCNWFGFFPAPNGTVVWSQIPGRVKKERDTQALKRPLLKDRQRGAAGVRTSLFSRPFKVHRSFRKTLNHRFYIWKYKCTAYCPLYTWCALVCLGLVWELLGAQLQHVASTNQGERTWLRLRLLSRLRTMNKHVSNQSYRLRETSKSANPL